MDDNTGPPPMAPIRSRPARESNRSWSRRVALASCFFLSFVAGFGYASWTLVCRGGRCPSIDVLDEYQPRQTSKLYAADGRFIAELGLERRTVVQLSQIPSLVREAFVVTEDKRFWAHHGIDYRRIPGAVVGDIRRRRWSQGFSTITMQLARNLFPERISREKSLTRKLKSELLDEMRTNGWPVTLSVGALTYQTGSATLQALIARTDALMYSVKRGGKNGVAYDVWTG